jgi:hypothetical protein
MNRNDFDFAIDCAAQEGWNPGLADAECFHAADPNGFFMGVLDSEPIACISAVAYDDNFGFLGLYIVREGFRGQGYGIQVWNAGMAYLGQRIVGLDGVVAQQENYKKSGFVLAHRNVRFGGTVDVTAPKAEEELVDASQLPTDRLFEYDRRFFPAPRQAFLRTWLLPESHDSLALLENGGLTGYGVIRQCRAGYKIGPLFADDAASADTLFRGLAAKAEGQMIYLDPPEPNPEAIALVKRYGMEPVFETARMYTEPDQKLPLERIFGITTFELG